MISKADVANPTKRRGNKVANEGLNGSIDRENHPNFDGT